MPDSQIAIDKILSGDQQSLFQALRLLSVTTENLNHTLSRLPNTLAFILSAEFTTTVAAAHSFFSLEMCLGHQQSGQKSVVPEEHTELLFIDLLLKQLWVSTNPHPAIKVQAQKFFCIIGIHFLQRPDLTVHSEHPYMQLVDAVLQQLCIWEPSAGRLEKKIPQQLDEITKEIGHLEISNRAELEKVTASFRACTQQQSQRAQTLQKRQVQSELASIDTEAARQSIISFIDLRLGGKPLPQPISQFITTTLVNDLQYLIITQGVESPLLKRWKRLLQILSWCFLPQDTPQQTHKINTLLVPFLEQLDNSLYREFSIQQGYKRFFDQLMELFILVLQQKPIAVVSFQPIEAETKSLAQTVVNQTLVTDLKEHQVGDWFWFTVDNGEKSRATLILKEPQKDTLFFSDYQGKITRKYSFEEFSLALALKSVQPMKCVLVYKNSLEKTLSILEQRYQNKQNQEKARQESENRKRSAQKALLEAESLSENKSTPESLQPIDSSQLTLYQQQLSSLHTGSWLLLSTENKEPKKIRLSVKIQAQDKYIFTDNVGHRVAEYTLADMANLMACKQLKILSRVQGFENSLEKIVRQIRNKKS